MIRYIYANMPFIVFKISIWNDNGKEYIETININGNNINTIVKFKIVKVSNKKYTTKHIDGYIPIQWFHEKFNYGQIIEQTTKSKDRCRIKYPELTYMVDTGNLIIESHIIWNSPGMSTDTFISLI